MVAAAFAKVLEAPRSPTRPRDSRSSSRSADRGQSRRRAGKTLILRTDLEPEVAQAQLKTLARRAARTTPTCSSSGSTNFGSTVAGETRTLALIATVASWLIIIVYLWFRFKSLIYGLAAVLAVVHDVLITLGAVAVTTGSPRSPASASSSCSTSSRSTCR